MPRDNIPKRVYNSLLDAGLTPDIIAGMSGKEVFRVFCEWEGLINWHETLWDAVEALSRGEHK